MAKIIGATRDHAWRVCLAFEGGTMFGQRVDKILYPEYYKHRRDYPCDPITGKELPIWEPPQVEPLNFGLVKFFKKVMNIFKGDTNEKM